MCSLSNNNISDELKQAVKAAASYNKTHDVSQKETEISAQADKVLSGSPTPEDLLAAISETMHFGVFDKSLLLIKKGAWKKALKAKVEAVFEENGVGKVR